MQKKPSFVIFIFLLSISTSVQSFLSREDPHRYLVVSEKKRRDKRRASGIRGRRFRRFRRFRETHKSETLSYRRE
ncbi:hypothetical protein GGR50DRAFT_348690 [Xylaria sp. CBS 124048]|nr:hypothetical protein GGR50DRAFT_348690 [Xylaria sp. CBS 124048]